MEKTTNNNTYQSGGIGLGTLIFLIFLFLKLSGKKPVANWSWWWVASPLWIPIALLLVLLIISMTISS